MNPNQNTFNEPYYGHQNIKFRPVNSDERLIGGGFAFPFLLGGVTGAALAPAFWNPRPYYNNYYPVPPYYPRPYYPRPYYPRPYR